MAYNEHLFGNPVSKFFHISRFTWLKEAWKTHAGHCNDTLELGCFDGRSYEFLDRKPKFYRGLDADWDGGLSLAQRKFHGKSGITFRVSKTAQDFSKERNFDSFISMETLEHISPAELEKYILIISRKLSGIAFISVPNETGFVFVLKNIAKVILGSSRPYSVSDFWNHFCGKTWRLSNKKGGHRGFNFNFLLHQLNNHFDIVSVTGLPFRRAPLWANTTIAVVLKTPNKLVDEGL